MRVLISGATGLVGSEVARQLKAAGHKPILLVRRSARASDEIQWNPAAGEIEAGIMESIDAVVNMAGATTGKLPWTKNYKKEIVDSRLNSTRTLVQAMQSAKNPPKVFVSGSASGYYGDSGSKVLTEDSPKGSGFLSDLSFDWEQEALKAPKSVRVVLARTTMIFSKELGALGRLLPLIKFGLGGPLGNGKQFWAWITQVDEAAAIIHLINTSSAVGAFNLTAPEPATCFEIVKSLAKKLNRPAIFPVPAFALKLVFGEGATELLLCSQNMSPAKLIATGFRYQHESLDSASTWVTNK
jgi:uncharacterized protein (TIGR01777 family)